MLLSSSVKALRPFYFSNLEECPFSAFLSLFTTVFVVIIEQRKKYRITQNKPSTIKYYPNISHKDYFLRNEPKIKKKGFMKK